MENEPQSDRKLRRIGAVAAFVEDLMLALGRVAFSLVELVQATGLSVIAAKFQLLRLRGKVVRVSARQPFFLIVGPRNTGSRAPLPRSGGCKIILIGAAGVIIWRCNRRPAHTVPIPRRCKSPR